METLGKIFGSEAKVKIMRLFLFNPGVAYDLFNVIERAHISQKEAKRQTAVLEKVKLINPKVFVKETASKKGVKKKKTRGWILNERFMYIKQLQSLLINTILLREEEIVRRLGKAGKVRFVAVAGVFIQKWDSRVDILVVGDRLKERVLDNVIKNMEAEIGKELTFAVLETSDFQYRLAMCDKLVRDILDFPHRRILDRLGLKLDA